MSQQAKDGLLAGRAGVAKGRTTTHCCRAGYEIATNRIG
jgi:hypothetical protein